MAIAGDVKLGQLTRYLFTAPSWPVSLLILIVLGLVIDGASARAWVYFPFSGTLAFTIPVIAGVPLHQTDHRVLRQDDDLEPFGAPCPCLHGLCRYYYFRFARRGNQVSPPLLRDLPWFCLWPASLRARCNLGLPPAPDDPAGHYPEWRGNPCRVFSLLTGMGVFCPRSPYRLRPRFCNPHLAHRAPALPCIPYPGSRVCQCIYRPHDGRVIKGMENFFREIGEEIFVPQVCLFFAGLQENRCSLPSPTSTPARWARSGAATSPGSSMTGWRRRRLSPTGAPRTTLISSPKARSKK